MDVNDLSTIDLKNIPISQLAGRYGTFHANKRNAPKKGRVGIQTAIGDVELKVWCEAVERVALREYESWIVDCLEEWNKKNPCVDIQREARLEALKLYASRMFEDEMWVGYVPFNRKYRPDAIKDKVFVTVIAECCNIPGEIISARYESGDTFCPACGRFIKVTVARCDNGGTYIADNEATNLMPPSVREKLKKSPLYSKDGQREKAEVVVKYWGPSGSGTWLITEGEEQENGDWLLFGMCHIFEWEWGYIMLSELENVRVPPFGLRIERDLYSSGTVAELRGVLDDGAA